MPKPISVTTAQINMHVIGYNCSTIYTVQYSTEQFWQSFLETTITAQIRPSNALHDITSNRTNSNRTAAFLLQPPQSHQLHVILICGVHKTICRTVVIAHTKVKRRYTIYITHRHKFTFVHKLVSVRKVQRDSGLRDWSSVLAVHDYISNSTTLVSK